MSALFLIETTIYIKSCIVHVINGSMKEKMMGDYVKGLRWLVVATLLVCGFALMRLADVGGVYYWIGPSLLLFGFAYLFGYFWHRYKRKQTLISFAVFLAGGIFAKFATQIVYIATGDIIDLHWAAWWVLFNIVVGLPVMAKVLD